MEYFKWVLLLLVVLLLLSSKNNKSLETRRKPEKVRVGRRRIHVATNVSKDQYRSLRNQKIGEIFKAKYI